MRSPGPEQARAPSDPPHVWQYKAGEEEGYSDRPPHQVSLPDPAYRDVWSDVHQDGEHTYYIEGTAGSG